MASSTTKPTARIKRHHRKVVQRVAQQVHHRERSDDGERKRETRNQCRREIPEEEEDDHDDQPEGQHHGELHVIVRFFDGLRTIVEDVHPDRRRQLGAEDRQQFLDVLRHLHGIRAGLALNREKDRALVAVLVVKPGAGLVVLDAVDDLAEFVEVNRRVISDRRR